MAKSPNVKQITQESGFYGPYSHFSRTLRAWLVAYGIGGPVLLVSQDHLSGLVLKSGVGLYISTLFLGGCRHSDTRRIALQILDGNHLRLRT